MGPIFSSSYTPVGEYLMSVSDEAGEVRLNLKRPVETLCF